MFVLHYILMDVIFENEKYSLMINQVKLLSLMPFLCLMFLLQTSNKYKSEIVVKKKKSWTLKPNPK